jgi:hypothetical protein
MTAKPRYLFISSMDVDADKEALFNEVYDSEHVPAILAVPGVIAATRYKVEPHEITIGDQTKTIPEASEPRYHAIYEFDDPAVMDSKEWAAAVEAGRWPAEVRPYTRNRRHALLKKT